MFPSSGVVPNKLKIARVIPVHKKGPIELSFHIIILFLYFQYPINYLKNRYKRLVKFLDNNKLLFSGQFGFRSNVPLHMLFYLLQIRFKNAIEKKLYSCGLFLDLSKAFDTVNNSILIRKLEHYAIRDIIKDWFCSYLTYRLQFLSIGNIKSDPKPITCGVPQGSVLGPLLFLLYINDFKNSASDLDFNLFADDSNLFYSHKSLQCLETKLNYQLCKVNE